MCNLEDKKLIRMVRTIRNEDDDDQDDKSTGCRGQAWGQPNGVAIPSSNLCTTEAHLLHALARH